MWFLYLVSLTQQNVFMVHPRVDTVLFCFLTSSVLWAYMAITLVFIERAFFVGHAHYISFCNKLFLLKTLISF